MLTETKLTKAIEGSYGNITQISKKLGLARSTIYDALKKFRLYDVLELEREKIIDLAESKLLENIRAGKENSILFTLRTLGRKRGYVEKQEINYKDETPFGMYSEAEIRKMVVEFSKYAVDSDARKKRIDELKQKLNSQN